LLKVLPSFWLATGGQGTLLRMAFTPFDKPIDDLTAPDLDVLLARRIAEGYFVEFKSDFPERRKLAHSIAAFANTYGGWLFIGVVTDDHNTANGIPGFDLDSTLDPISTTRDVIRSYIDPVPLFHSKLVVLPTGKAVLLIEVPDGQDTPFITNDGRVYRRVADAKDPVAETNRHALDALVVKGRRLEEQFREFCQDDRPTYNDDPSWLSFYFSPYPLGRVFVPKIFESDYVTSVLEASRGPNRSDTDGSFMQIHFGVGQHTHRSVILRSNQWLQSPYKHLALEFFLDGAAKLFVPIPTLDAEKFGEKLEGIAVKSGKAKDAWTHFLKEAEENAKAMVRLFDLSDTMLVVGGLLNNYRNLLGRENTTGEFQVAVTLGNVSRVVPFV
jgi:hypothetical protein